MDASLFLPIVLNLTLLSHSLHHPITQVDQRPVNGGVSIGSPLERQAQ